MAASEAAAVGSGFLGGLRPARAMHLGASSCFMLSFVTLKLHSAGGSRFGNAVGEGLRMPPVSHGGPSRSCPTLTHPLEALVMASVISLWVKDGENGNCLKGVMRAGAQLSWQGAWLRCTKPWIPSPATHSMHVATHLYPHTPVVEEEEPEV